MHGSGGSPDVARWANDHELVSLCSFNGCSNQILSLAINGSYVDSRYILCPAGIHEGEQHCLGAQRCTAASHMAT